ncbi:arsinothricin resistance N-acetyltransferase ArsN1 family B [Shewanella salipaludis]|uniref:N-acetyltransferase n=1 Tax=Shewanella salipaludis TaxID=2723052 RepID=A0A972FRX6_9GAMM|nr:arsinothricin resistance N-acetyltransferase ArsN1 family B [Shewanella salipaludis]NMH64144.1 N-acetyltransferase [Shewanella salipaludis]
MIRKAVEADSEVIAGIYNHYIENTAITFEEEKVSATEINRRIQNVQAAGLPWLVAVEDSVVVGYTYATKWKDRSAYRFSVEVTVYLAPGTRGKGYGSMLYIALMAELKACGVQSVIGGITLPNQASVALHEKMGMKKVAHFEKIGFKFDQWQDVGYWQKSLHS